MYKRQGGDYQADGADGVIVAGDNIVELVRVAVRIDDGDDGDVQLAGLGDGVALLAGVNDEQEMCIRDSAAPSHAESDALLAL